MPVASVLFAAGRGERLRPLTDRVPKPALPILDVPLGAFGLARLVASAPPTTINVRHLGRAVTRALQPWGTFSVLDEAPEAFGTAGTLAALRSRAADRILTYNADLLSDLDVDRLLAAHRGPATLAVVRVDTGADLELEGDRPIRLVDRRTEPRAAGARFLGAAVLGRACLELIPDRRPLGLTEGLLGPLVERGETDLFFHDGYARDVGTAADYVAANLDLLAGLGPGPPGGSWPGEIVAVEGGLAYVGPGAEVQARSLGPGAVVMAGARVEAGTRLERTVVLPRTSPSPRGR